jgi:redox-sensitive bicupin YhaK (pirin superfamily)
VITIRKADERGRTKAGWLDSHHTFSFGEYYDPKHLGFSVLRVINDDRVAPGAGFATHPHRDMEIVTYVLEGALEHKDSMGNGSVIVPGEVQRMSAGTGVTHSEFNPSKTEPVHFLQIWVLPGAKGLPPGYEQKKFSVPEKSFRLVASPDGSDGSVSINQDAKIYAGRLTNGGSLRHALSPTRKGWLHVARGEVKLKDTVLHEGDAAALQEEQSLELSDAKNAELLLFDLP